MDMECCNGSHYSGPQAEWFVVDQPQQYQSKDDFG